MDDNKLLDKIGNLIDEKLQPIKEDLKGVKNHLEIVELKVEAVNKKVDNMHQDLSQKIEQSQQETIEVLSDIIHTGYEKHKKRIKLLEKQTIP